LDGKIDFAIATKKRCVDKIDSPITSKKKIKCVDKLDFAIAIANII
jgi:hypothetical protein